MNAQPQFPLVLLRDLPQLAITPDAKTTVPVVQDNVLTGRLSWALWTAGLAKLEGNSPTEQAASGDEGYFAADNTGIYAYKNGEWHKAPVYNDKWDDLTVNTRFLLVNESMDLSDEEIANARASLKIHIATQTEPGLVRAMTQAEQNACPGTPLTINPDGTAYIVSATGTTPGVVTVWDGIEGNVATTAYVAQQIALIKQYELPVAQPGRIGGIQSDAEQDGVPGIFTVTSEGQVKIRSAYVPTEPTEEDGYGLVKLADAIEFGNSGVVTSDLLYNDLQSWFTEVYGVATPLNAGIVRPYTEGIWTGEYIAPTGTNVGPLFFRDNQGGIDIYPAGATVPGVAMVYDAIPLEAADLPVSSKYPITASLGAVKTYVDNKLTTVKVAVEMEPATKQSAGAVLPADAAFILTDDGTLTLRDALPGSRGLANIATEVRPDQDDRIPDIGLLREYTTNVLTPIRQSIRDIQEQISTLTSVTAGMQGQIDGIYAGDNPNMSAGYFGANGDISGIHQLLQQNVSNVQFLTTVSNDNSAAIGALSNTVAAIDQTVGVLGEDAGLSSTAITALISEVEVLTTDLETANTTIEGLVSDIAWLKAQFTDS